MKRTFPACLLPYLLMILLPGFFLSGLQAQECSEKLRMAEELYTQGLVERIPGLLFPCIEQGFNNQQKIRAYKLIILAYYFDDAYEEATQTMENFLRVFPDFMPDTEDDPRFVSLFDSFEKKIIFATGFQAGASYVLPTFVRGSATYAPGMIISEKYSWVPVSWRAGLSAEYTLSEKFNLGWALAYASTSYRNELVLDPGTGEINLTYTENFQTIDFPLYAEYNFSRGRVQPYLMFGSQVSYLLSAKADIVHVPPAGEEISGTGIDLSGNRFGLMTSVLVGGGGRWFLDKSYFFMEMGYIQGLSFHRKSGSNPLSGQADPVSNELLWTYLYSADNFRLSQVTFCVGYRIFFNRVGLK